MADPIGRVSKPAKMNRSKIICGASVGVRARRVRGCSRARVRAVAIRSSSVMILATAASRCAASSSASAGLWQMIHRARGVVSRRTALNRPRPLQVGRGLLGGEPAVHHHDLAAVAPAAQPVLYLREDYLVVGVGRRAPAAHRIPSRVTASPITLYRQAQGHC
jgi:hypothetical protein